jgi:hypothetical protein
VSRWPEITSSSRMNKRASSSLSSSSLSSSLFSTMSFMIAFCRRKTASRIDGLYLFVVVMYFGGMYAG